MITSENKHLYTARLQARCSLDVPGCSPGFTYFGDTPLNERAKQGILNNAKASLEKCAGCIGAGCQTYNLAHASIQELNALLNGDAHALAVSE